jgi:hypothetical protein
MEILASCILAEVCFVLQEMFLLSEETKDRRLRRP